jgi:peptidylprolyl isomerase
MHFQKTRGFCSFATTFFLIISFSMGTSAADMASPKPTVKIPPILSPKIVKPRGSSAEGFVFNPTVTKRIDIWEDLQCSNCAKFDVVNQALLNKVIASKLASVNFHTLAFLGAESEDLANAVSCASDENKFLALRDKFFKLQQATKNSGFWSSGQIIKTAATVGLTSRVFQICVTSHKYLVWLKSIEALTTKKNISATPTVLINNIPLNRTTDYSDPVRLEKVIHTPSLIVPTPTSADVSQSSGGFNVSKVFGIEPTFNKPTGVAPTSPLAGDVILGSGEQVQQSDTVTVQYVLMVWDSGNIVESSWKTGPATFPLNRVIKGWAQGIPGMRVGGRRILVLPPNWAYGPNATGPIPANSTLIFVVDLLATRHKE